MPELHRWISKLTARHLQACPPGDLISITMVKETVILYKKEFKKMKKSLISHWSESDENAKSLQDCLWLCQACKRVLHVGLCKEIFARKHTAAQKPTSARPLIVATMTHIHLTRELVAVEPRRPPMTDVGTESAFRLDQRKHFQKSKRLLRSEVSWCDQTSIDLHLRRSTCASTCE